MLHGTLIRHTIELYNIVLMTWRRLVIIMVWHNGCIDSIVTTIVSTVGAKGPGLKNLKWVPYLMTD